MHEHNSSKAILYLGIGYVLFGIGLNPWLLGLLFTADGTISSPVYRVILWSAEGVAVAFGLLTLLLRRRTIAARIQLVPLTLLCLLVVTELFLRRFAPQFIDSDHDKLFVFNPVYGWEFKPESSAMVGFKGTGSRMIEINSAGMRDREYTVVKPQGKKRICVLGDSFVSCLEVDNEKVFTEILEDSLCIRTEVLNFGVNGYGPGQEYLLLKNRVLDYHPDLVIMVIYVRNDLDDLSGEMEWVRGYARPAVRLGADGSLAFSRIPPSSSDRTIAETSQSHGIHLIKFVTDRLDSRYGIYQQPQELRLCKLAQSSQLSDAYRLLEAVLSSADNLCRSNETKFAVVLAPSIVQVYSDKYWQRLFKDRNLNPDEYDMMLPNTKIKDICQRVNIRLLDLTPALKEMSSGDEALYFPEEKHWTEAGNRVVAKALAGFLSAWGF